MTPNLTTQLNRHLTELTRLVRNRRPGSWQDLEAICSRAKALADLAGDEAQTVRIEEYAVAETIQPTNQYVINH